MAETGALFTNVHRMIPRIIVKLSTTGSSIPGEALCGRTFRKRSDGGSKCFWDTLLFIFVPPPLGFTSMPGPEERLWRSDSKVVGSQRGLNRTGKQYTPGTNYCSCGDQDEFRGASCRLFSSKITSLHPSLSIVVALLALTLSGGLAQDVDESSSAQGDEDSSGSGIWTTLLSYAIIVLLVAASGMFSGLTLGLLGLDKIGLEIISNGDEPRIAAYAKVGDQEGL